MKSDQTTKKLGEVRRDIIHHMGRRCRDWDYGGRAIYMITINLKERGRPVMAEWARSLDDSAEAQEQNLPVSGQAQNWPGNGLRSASAETPAIRAVACGGTMLSTSPPLFFRKLTIKALISSICSFRRRTI